jgi:hypothetical protein
MNNQSSYATVANRPIACTFCGAHVQGQVTPIQNPNTKITENVCKWVCSRCNNLVRVGKVN